jgi:hypothetical protein
MMIIIHLIILILIHMEYQIEMKYLYQLINLSYYDENNLNFF